MEGDREKRFKVLIVDDVPENIHILMETLKDEFSLVAATGGERPCAWPGGRLLRI